MKDQDEQRRGAAGASARAEGQASSCRRWAWCPWAAACRPPHSSSRTLSSTRRALARNIGHLYAPWSILQWVGEVVRPVPRRDHARRQHRHAGCRPWACSAWPSPRLSCRNTSKANEYLHGSARWAEKKDIQAAGLLPRPRTSWQIVTGKDAPTGAGVYVGGWQDKDGKFYYLRHNGPEHVLYLRADPLRQGCRPGGARRCCRGRRAPSSPT